MKHTPEVSPNGNVELTEDDINKALDRLFFAVADEPTPNVWLRSDKATPIAAGGTGISDATMSGVAIPNLQGTESALAHTEPTMSLHSRQAEDTQEGSNIVGADPLHFADPAPFHTDSAAHTLRAKKYKRHLWMRIAGGVAAAGVLAGVAVSPIGSRAIADAMQTFYVQNIVGVGQDDLTQIENALAQPGANGTSRIDLKQYGSVEISGHRTGESLSLADAASHSGLPVKVLPGFQIKTDKVFYTGESDITFRMNVSAINDLIQRLGGSVLFPTSVNGEPIVVHVPDSIQEGVNGTNGNYMNLLEMKVPSVQVPADVNLSDVKQALLNLPFLPNDIRQSLFASVNWQETLYVPVGGSPVSTTVNGNAAVMQFGAKNADPEVVWLENGVLYQLSGSSSVFATPDALLTVAKEVAG